MSRPSSKFSGLLSAVQAPAPAPPRLSDSAADRTDADGPPKDTAGADPLPDRSPTATAAPRPASAPRTGRRPAPATPSDAAPTGATSRRRGRPAGKRSDPDFDQVTAYIRRQTYRDVRIALLSDGRGQEFSELVEELLAGWLTKHR